jgi:osmotically inducible lipoprotein OsmB
MRKLMIALAGVTMLGLAGCGHSTGDRAVSGGLIGAGGGAVAGAALGNPLAGAVVGGVAGAGVGAATPDHDRR